MKTFEEWVRREYRPKTAYDILYYVKDYWQCLSNQNLSPLLGLSNDKRSHCMKALSTLSKSLGVHEHFLKLIRDYGLKWTVRNDDLLIARYTKRVDSNAVFDWISQVKAKCPELTCFVDLMLSTGLRFDEAIQAYNLIIRLGKENKLDSYFNVEHSVLEHFRFREIFIRRTKKAFVSFVDPELIKTIAEKESLNPICNSVKSAETSR